jgi:hypothetical protein
MMSYRDRFVLVDGFLSHVDTLMGGIQDPLIRNNYLGFIVTAAVTAYELSIKDIFIEFSARKHLVLGTVVSNRFEKMNGRISLNDLRNDHVKMFGDKYVIKFNAKLNEAENISLRNGNGSPKASYGNVLVWRNNFVHKGDSAATTNYEELKKSYERGKGVIDCLAAAMRR